MKTKHFIIALFASLVTNLITAQDRTTVTATTDEISDNLDLRAVASIFGDSNNLDDFERRLNDPKFKISNLDLNGDNQVDYLRVVESVEGSTHLIIIQSVLGRDNFQDVATVEVEKDRHNNIQVQVVGDVYMYGSNYIYEPVYYQQPVIYNTFWVNNYNPYYSSWYYGYYPTYYYAWAPYPVHHYWSNVNHCINVHHHYNYVNVRRSQRAIALHNMRRANAYEAQYPTRSFAHRNTRAANRYELDNNIRRNSTGTTRTAFASSSPQNGMPKGGVRSATVPVRSNTMAANHFQPATPKNEVAENVVNTNVTPKGQYSGPKTVTSSYNATGTPRNGTRTQVVPTTSPKPESVVPKSGIRNTYSAPITAAPASNTVNTIRQVPQRSQHNQSSSVRSSMSSTRSTPMNNTQRGRR